MNEEELRQKEERIKEKKDYEETLRKNRLMEEMMLKASLNIDISDLVFRKGKNKKEILDEILHSCILKLFEIDNELRSLKNEV